MIKLTIKIIQLFGICTAAIALATMAGYIFDKPYLYRWFDVGPPMAANSSVALFITGISIVLMMKVLKKEL